MTLTFLSQLLCHTFAHDIHTVHVENVDPRVGASSMWLHIVQVSLTTNQVVKTARLSRNPDACIHTSASCSFTLLEDDTPRPRVSSFVFGCSRVKCLTFASGTSRNARDGIIHITPLGDYGRVIVIEFIYIALMPHRDRGIRSLLGRSLSTGRV